jgi:hypothetical protein
MAKTFLKKTPQKVAVKAAGSGVTETITLATDLLHTTEVVSGTPAVDIQAMYWTGAAAGVATITRNAVTVSTLVGQRPGYIDFTAAEFRDSTNNTSDIVVTTTGQMEVWLLLRKVTGYSSKIEDAQYGSYDDPSRIGASTTISGSPDKV